jgi:hypothetical protein
VRTLASPAVAQTPPSDGASIAAAAKDAAGELQAYLDKVAKAHGRPDFSKPPASDLLGRIFDFGKLAALPAPSATEIPWLLVWTSAASQAGKSLLYFGITPPANPIADRAAIERNMVELEDQQSLGFAFLVRIAAREAQDMFLFMDQLTPEQRTPIREQGFTTAHAGAAETVYGVLITLTSNLKPANERLLSAAIGDTANVWLKDILPKDRPDIVRQAVKAQSAMKDAEAKKSIAAFSTAMAAVKDPVK